MQPICPLDHLPTAGRHEIQDVMEDIRVHGDPASSNSREMQDVLNPPLYAIKERVGTPTGACRHGQLLAVAHLVANERLGAAEEHRDEDLLPIPSWRHGMVLIIDHLGDHQILKEV